MGIFAGAPPSQTCVICAITHIAGGRRIATSCGQPEPGLSRPGHSRLQLARLCAALLAQTLQGAPVRALSCEYSWPACSHGTRSATVGSRAAPVLIDNECAATALSCGVEVSESHHDHDDGYHHEQHRCGQCNGRVRHRGQRHHHRVPAAQPHHGSNRTASQCHVDVS